MDYSAKEITFDEYGVCNFCKEAKKKLEILNFNKKNNFFEKIIENIKKNKNNNSEYDCICGVSGGLDSSYLIHVLKENDINPLAVHFDNGWNTNLAVENIHNLLSKLNIDLYTHVVDWYEFKNLQKSFFLSSLANLEIPTDHSIFSLLYNLAEKKNIKYILHGGNQISESIMPESWMESYYDQKLIFSVNKKFQNKTLKTIPTQNYFSLFKKIFFKKIKYIGILNYIDYDIAKSKKILNKKYNWIPYAHKHGESFFTNFFQNYILPEKFNIDKRKAHLSSLIASNQISKNEALQIFNKDLRDKEEDSKNIDFFCSKLDLDRNTFDKIIKSPRVNLNKYKNNQMIFEKVEIINKLVKKVSNIKV